MGIEPTNRMLYIRSNGFEDRGQHQPCKHFPESAKRKMILALTEFRLKRTLGEVDPHKPGLQIVLDLMLRGQGLLRNVRRTSLAYKSCLT